MNRWLRVVLPFRGALPVLLGIYILCEAPRWYLEWKWGPLPQGEGGWPSAVVLGAAAMAYGLIRVIAFHPVIRQAYGDWLATTPWTSRKPLPMGPVQLVWQDVLLVGIAVALAWLTPGMVAARIVQLFGLVYLVALGATLMLTGDRPFAYAVWLGCGLVVYGWKDPWLSLPALLISYVVGYAGLRRSLTRFPWDLKRVKVYVRVVYEETDRFPPQTWGWPFDRLGPQFPNEIRMPLLDAVAISVLLGWWVYAFSVHLPADEQMKLPAGLLILGSIVLPFFRLARYCNGYRPPISFWGRLATARLLIPRYDQVYVAPLLATFVGVAYLVLNGPLGPSEPASASAAGAVAVFISLGMGPDLRTWRLTGTHRVVEGSLEYPVVKVG
jgi:hypothetical protein